MFAIIGIVLIFVMVFGGYVLAGGKMGLILKALPWTGRTEFKAVTGPLRVLAGKAENLRRPYGERLARHRGELRDLCSGLGWTFNLHRTDMAPAAALLHLHQLIAGSRDRRAGGFIR